MPYLEEGLRQHPGHLLEGGADPRRKDHWKNAPLDENPTRNKEASPKMRVEFGTLPTFQFPSTMQGIFLRVQEPSKSEGGTYHVGNSIK